MDGTRRGNAGRLVLLAAVAAAAAILSAVAKELAEFLGQSNDVVRSGQEDLRIDSDRELQKLVLVVD
ncbi:hypothetical protein [Lentzea flava]|uniref:Uncharacterized protein n=1 Tax=Lentzea flava TaxID=103732 RepID=A0ABQ2ULB7_9PSEU|nr:hypothetical protein [Lentzea flava]GGU43280.1 hypothetical protein GCM10010178_39720 [Lentzea flava]